MATYDVIVVGARCAGAIAAGRLAGAGLDVCLIDKAHFPSDTISTHAIFPNTLARFATLGILERLEAKHQLSYIGLRWRIVGYELAGLYTPIEGRRHATSIRRISLDAVLVDWAVESGAHTRFGARVVGLLGAGTDDDPVRGVILDNGDELQARWVIGADGRASSVVGMLGLEKKKPMVGEMAYLFAYWRGLPNVEWGSLEVSDHKTGLMWNPSEDGVHLLSVAGPPEFTRGSPADREREYAKGLAEFPETFDPAWAEKGERISNVIVVPETMMRGFYRKANGPGWVLVGDSGHFKHPGTAQGISDAVEQAVFVADAIAGADPELATFHDWRKERSSGFYEWSFLYGSWPIPGMVEPYMEGLAADPEALQDWIDTFTRLKRPEDVNTPERLAAWLS